MQKASRPLLQECLCPICAFSADAIRRGDTFHAGGARERAEYPQTPQEGSQEGARGPQTGPNRGGHRKRGTDSLS
jgi:hypothetical protein